MTKDWKTKDRLPVTGMNWYEASAWCTWAGKCLPAEAEWEDGIVPVRSCAQNKSPYGVFDIASNVLHGLSGRKLNL